MSDSLLRAALRRVLHRHRWAYMGEAVARSTPHIAYPVNQVCVGCRVLRFKTDAPGRPSALRLGDSRQKPKPDGGQIHA